MKDSSAFLPTTLAEARTRGWDSLDIVLISGDAYIDHPSFGPALIGRALEAKGLRVGIIPQPDWTKDEDFLALGVPRLFFGISSGNMDSMVNHYTAQRKRRNDDAYSPDGHPGLRPDRAVIIYANLVKRLFKSVPIVLGGIEASLRRIAHYDYWQDKVRGSILADSKADLLVYGMGERAVAAIAEALQAGRQAAELNDIEGTVVFSSSPPDPDAAILPAAESCKDKNTFLALTRLFVDRNQSETLYQQNAGRWIRHNPPAKPLSEAELDALYALPFMNLPHPRYEGRRIPAFEQIRDSITSHRGCYGGCSFCAIGCHQGRAIQSRSPSSILAEVKGLAEKRRKAITISDVGGPTANMYGSSCALGFPASCKRRSCLLPRICPNLRYDHAAQLKLLADIEALDEVNHVYISSGIRHDLALNSPKYISALAQKYTGGRLKLAPEHSVPSVLRLMGKPSVSSFEDFSREFHAACRKASLKRQIIPYIIIGHPGTSVQDALDLRSWLKRNNLRVEQVQEFTPTPMTVSTCMYYTGLDFETGKPIHIPKPSEIRRQKELALWHLN
jgi:uncharacterized radical SAM protein YgiQ